MRAPTWALARTLPIALLLPLVGLLVAPRPASAAARPSAYQPLAVGQRLLDTRSGAPLPDGGAVTLPVAGRAGLPGSGLTAVVLNVTAVGAAAPGFVQAFPAGEISDTSALNMDRAGQTVAALTVVRVGAGGAITLRTQHQTHLVVDVLGGFRAADRPRAGRIVPLDGVRALDTRGGARLGSGEVRLVSVRAQVPGDAAAAVVNLTAVGATAPGFVEAVADVAGLGRTSNLNLDRPGQTRANLAIVPLRGDRTFSVRSSTPTDLLVDVVGYVTSDAASASEQGMFVATNPVRILDTRGGAALPPGASATATAAAAGVPSGAASAVLTTVTAVSAAAGFLATGPAPGPVTGTSTLNTAGPSSTVANAALVRLSTSGLAVTTSNYAHVLVDVAGYLVGVPQRAAAPPASPSAPPSSTDAWAFWGYLFSDGRFADGHWIWNQQPYAFTASAQRFVRGAAANGIGLLRSGSSYQTTTSVPSVIPIPGDPAAIAAFLAAIVEDEGNACTGLIEDDPSRSRMDQVASLLNRVGVAHRLEGASGNWRVFALRSSWPIVASWPYATTARTPGVGYVCP